MSRELIITCDKKGCNCTEEVETIYLQNGWTYISATYNDEGYNTPKKTSIDLCPKHKREFQEKFNEELFKLVQERKYFKLVDDTISKFKSKKGSDYV